MSHEFTFQEWERLFGGIGHRRNPITDGTSWATLELAHDAYSASQIVQLLEGLDPEFACVEFEYRSPRWLAKIGKAYVLVDGPSEEVEIVGENQDVGSVGAKIILNAKFGDTTEDRPKNIGTGVSWERMWFASDIDERIAFRKALPDLNRLGDIQAPHGLSFGRIGESAYYRLTGMNLDLIGQETIVEQAGEIVRGFYKRDIRSRTLLK